MFHNHLKNRIFLEIFKLTAIFFGFTFLAATQDIAVDGWALTMLSK
jgi:PAT family acetyl-CoA transporter-like MFS transporter 1